MRSKGVSHGSQIVLVKTHECRARHGYGTHMGHTLSHHITQKRYRWVSSSHIIPSGASLYTTYARRVGFQRSQQRQIGQHTGHEHLPVRYSGHESYLPLLRFGVGTFAVTTRLSRAIFFASWASTLSKALARRRCTRAASAPCSFLEAALI